LKNRDAREGDDEGEVAAPPLLPTTAGGGGGDEADDATEDAEDEALDDEESSEEQESVEPETLIKSSATDLKDAGLSSRLVDDSSAAGQSATVDPMPRARRLESSDWANSP
jgi:hypothetical protein